MRLPVAGGGSHGLCVFRAGSVWGGEIHVPILYTFLGQEMSDLKDQILARISAGARSSVWTPNDFVDLGTYDAVRKTLQRLATANDIRRIDDGLYDRPAPNPLTRQQNPPDARQVIDAIARRSQIDLLLVRRPSPLRVARQLLQHLFDAGEPIVALDGQQERLGFQFTVVGVEEGDHRCRLAEVTPGGLHQVALPA